LGDVFLNQERRGGMKALVLCCTLVLHLVFTGNSIAAHYTKVHPGGTKKPVASAIDSGILDEKASPETIDSLLQKLDNPDPFVRVAAVQALGEIRQDRSLFSLCGCLTDENLYVRGYAAEALGKIGHLDTSYAIEQLSAAPDDPSPYVRSMMVLALGELQDKRAINTVRKLLQDEDETVRKMAAWALKKIEASQ
jgi:HEAT repeat protein